MTYEELEQFDADILDIENPQLQRYLMNGDSILPEHDNKYMNILVNYIDARMADYAQNVPKSRLRQWNWKKKLTGLIKVSEFWLNPDWILSFISNFIYLNLWI